MPNGMQIAVSGILAQQARLDLIANDLANVNTVGYRRARVAFQEIATPQNDGSIAGGGVRALDGGRSSAQGTLIATESPLSVALDGPGYIQVKLAGGSIALSRGGDLRLDDERSLVLPTGERLEPPVTLPAGATPEDVAVASDGTVEVTGKKIGRITVVDVPAPDGLLPTENGLVQPTQASGAAAPVKGTQVQQGYLETSNVDVATSMVELIETQRTFGLVAKAIQIQDQLLQLQNEIRR
jgi:flagellar basal-body rod protein FlgG